MAYGMALPPPLPMLVDVLFDALEEEEEVYDACPCPLPFCKLYLRNHPFSFMLPYPPFSHPPYLSLSYLLYLSFDDLVLDLVMVGRIYGNYLLSVTTKLYSFNPALFWWYLHNCSPG